MISPTKNDLSKATLIALLYLCTLFITSTAWQAHQHSNNTNILLDKLANEVNTGLLPKNDNYFGLPSATLAYMAELNVALEQAHWNIQISKIADVSLSPFNTSFVWQQHLIANPGSDSFSVTLDQQYAFPKFIYVLLAVPLFAISLIGMRDASEQTHQKNAEVSKAAQKMETSSQPNNRLTVDLIDKELRYDSQRCSALPLKQFAFYAALLEICADKDIELFSEDVMPEDLIAAAKNYYKLLVANGHPKRGRPDFENNVASTISQIRSTLSNDLPNLPQQFIPPKASGEGSRIQRKGAQCALKELSKENFIVKQ